MILNGKQGSAKSTTARALRNLIGPANPVARSTPNSEQDLVIAAKHSHVLAFVGDPLEAASSVPSYPDYLAKVITGVTFKDGIEAANPDQIAA